MPSISLDNVELTRFFFAVTALLVCAHIFGYGFSRFNFPRAVGEIAGGILLGPTVLGFLYPQAWDWLFNAFEAEGKLISAVYWFGLIFLMFISGFELQKSIDRRDRFLIGSLLLGSTIIPFAAGWLFPEIWDQSYYIGKDGNELALRVVLGSAMAVTSIPVISRIFIDLDLIGSRFAKVVLTTAVLHDILLWVALAVASSVQKGVALSFKEVAVSVVVTLLFFAVALLALPRFLQAIGRSWCRSFLAASPCGYVLIFCFFLAALASVLSVNVIFGAFVAGVVLALINEEKLQKEKLYIKEISLAFFTPLYFAIVGLKIDLIQFLDLPFLAFYLLLAVSAQLTGTIIAAKAVGQDNATSLNLAVAMNTRGGPGIVLASVAYEMGVINAMLFTTMVLTAIITSVMAGYWFKFMLSRGLKLL